jgi:hypothetical protein
MAVGDVPGYGEGRGDVKVPESKEKSDGYRWL